MESVMTNMTKSKQRRFKMNIFPTFIVLLLFSICINVFADTPPSDDIIQSWWQTNSTEKMTIEGKPEQIALLNKEIAYLVPVGFYDRGRNFIWHIVMVRPKINEVRELDESVRRDIIVHDLNHDGISEIETVSLGSGQGTTIGVKSIVQFNDWKPIILHQKEFHDNLGCCGKWGCGSCESIEVKWKFVDLTNDRDSYLIEESKIIKGSKIKNHITRYLFKNNTFIKIKAK
jgi:hypothetical protein